MKTIIPLLLAFTFMFSPVFAQQETNKKKVTLNNPILLEMPENLKTVDPLNGYNFLFGYMYNQQNPTDSNSVMKLDSVVTYDNSPSDLTRWWISPYKNEFIYDPDFRLQQVIEKTWHRSKKVYGITGKNLYFYNSTGLIDSTHFYNLLTKYQTSSKFHYNSNGILETVYDYSFDYWGWTIQSKKQYSYNELGLIMEIEIYSTYYNNTYFTKNVLKFSYDSSNNLMERTCFAPGGKAEKETYERDSEGKILKHTLEDYLWNFSTTYNCSYDVSGDLIRYSWSDSSFIEYTYFDFGNVNLVPWQIPNKDVYQINGLPEFYSDRLLNEIKTYSNNKLVEKSIYYYSPAKKEVISETGCIQNTFFSVFPNPASDKITFNWSQNKNNLNFKLFLITGACVMDLKISSGQHYNVDHLPKGVYVFKISDDIEVLKSGKLVIK